MFVYIYIYIYIYINNTFNNTYHPVFLKLKAIVYQRHLLLRLDREYGRAFERVPTTGLKRAKSLKDIFMRAR